MSQGLSIGEMHLAKLMSEYKPRTDSQKRLHALTQYLPVVELQIVADIKAGKRDAKEVNEMRCPICMCDLYDAPIDI
jgi:hypothetical protein